MEYFSFLWVGSLIGTVIVVQQKNLSGWFILLAFLTGPLAFVTVMLCSSRQLKKDPDIEHSRDEVRILYSLVKDLTQRVRDLENHVGYKGNENDVLKKSLGRTLLSEDIVKPIDKPSEISEQSIRDNKKRHSPVKKPSHAEINFGKFWLNKIGIVIFTLGVGFFISYSFKYFSPLMKDLFGYVVAGVLFFLGNKFEKQEKMKHYGLALLGAAWALTYFTTYALYHFQASRVIFNQFIDLALLFLVAAGMMTHALKYKSETMMMVALGVAYVTSLIGAVTAFTFGSSIILGCVVVFLLYRFQWIKTLFLGLGMTYGIHQFFIVPAIHHGTMGTAGTGLNLAFLASYGVLYFTGTHLVIGKSDTERNIVSAANFGNFVLLFVMSNPDFQRYFPDRRVMALAIISVIYVVSGILARKYRRYQLYLSDLVVGMFAFTLAVYLEFLPYTSLMIWMIETPFILYAGLKFKDNILRYVSYALTMLCFLRIGWLSGQSNVQIQGVPLTLFEYTALLGCTVMAGCYWICRRDRNNNFITGLMGKSFSGFSVFYLILSLWSMIAQTWLPLCLMVVVPMVLFIARWLNEKVLLAAGLVITCISVIQYIISGELKMYNVDFYFSGFPLTVSQWTYLTGCLSMSISFCLTNQYKKVEVRSLINDVSGHVYSGLAVGLLSILMWSKLGDHWLTVGLTAETVALFIIAQALSLKRFRAYCYGLLGIVTAKFLWIDEYQSLGMLKWMIITLELFSFFGIYYLSQFSMDKNAKNRPGEIETGMVFLLFLILLIGSVFRYAEWGWRSLSLGSGAVILILYGLFRNDRISRLGGFLLLGLSLLRIIFVDLQQLTPMLKIISFIVLGAMLLGISFLYNKHFTITKE
ncbi:MAG: DUF2339 domain-containing protein [Candidatus Omnitrophota bacterium]